MDMRPWTTLFVLAFLPCLGFSQVVINEFSCSNYTLGIAGDNEDFVEFYNPSGTDVDLGGHFLSDNPANLDKFEIPAGTVVPAGGYLMVMCSAEGELLTNLYVGGFLNTNFKVNQCQGEAIVFSDPGGNVLESYTYGADIHTTQADHSWSRTTDGASTWSVCLSPTPEAANVADMVNGYAPNPIFSLEAGHYDASMFVELSVPAGYEIRYTLNGYSPTGASTLYTGPINVSNTTVVRAVSIDPSGVLAPSFIETNTFFVGADAHTIPVVSVSGNGQEDGEWGWGGNDELAHIEFFHPDGTFWVEATGDTNEHGNDSNAYGH